MAPILDISVTATGAAVGSDASNLRTLPAPNFSAGFGYGETERSYIQWLSDMITTERPDMVVIEAPLLVANKASAARIVYQLIGLARITRGICALREISEFHEVHVSTWRKLMRMPWNSNTRRSR